MIHLIFVGALLLASSCFAAPRMPPSLPPSTIHPTPPWDCKFDGSQFKCDTKCIPIEQRCDGTQHCLDGTDELNCDPEEVGDKFEGDIVLEKGQSPFKENRNGVIDNNRKWPGGIVPYEIIGSFTDDQKTIFSQTFAEYHAKTCIKFVPRTSLHKNWVQINNENTRACYSNVGKLTREGPQTVNYGDWCFKKFGTMLHELAHALGFYHEQSRHDRDDFVVVLWKNIIERYKGNFQKHTDKDVHHYGSPYDYGSMMHYGSKGFSINGQATIVPRINVTLGQRVGFSPSDLFKINKMYECDKKGFVVTLPPSVTWPTGPLPTIAIPSPAPVNISGDRFVCNFDSDQCSFTSDWLEPFEWERHHGETPSPGTGPLADHTTGFGYYMYTEASESREGMKSVMYSPKFVKSGGYCLKFWYNMNGRNMGKLNVYTKVGLYQVKIFNQTGPHGTHWHMAQRFVNIANPTQIVFEGIRGKSFQSDLAIDDFSFVSSTQASCRNLDKETSTTSPPTTVPDGTTFLSCSFDSDTCKFEYEGKFKWDRQKGNTSSPSTGPQHDVSKLLGRPEGYYMYTEASWNANKIGSLVGPISPKVKSFCLDFYYHMYDKNAQDMGTLNVYYRSNVTNTNVKVFAVSGNQGNQWHHTQQYVSLTSDTFFRIMFEGVVGKSFASDIAIDEIKLKSGRC